MRRAGTTPAVLAWHQAAPGVPVGTTFSACWLLGAGSVSGRFTSCRVVEHADCQFAAVAADESVVGGSLGTRHSRVTGKIGANTAWIRARPPASLPRCAR